MNETEKERQQYRVAELYLRWQNRDEAAYQLRWQAEKAHERAEAAYKDWEDAKNALDSL